MRKSLLSLATGAVLLAAVGLAQAQTTTSSTTWTNDQGTMFRDHSKSMKYVGVTDPAMMPKAGMEMPSTVTLYDLPPGVKVMPHEHYSYTMINNNPVIVDTTTRKVVHSWAPVSILGGGGG